MLIAKDFSFKKCLFLFESSMIAIVFFAVQAVIFVCHDFRRVVWSLQAPNECHPCTKLASSADDKLVCMGAEAKEHTATKYNL